MDKGSVAKTLRQMEVSGFITRKEDPEDRRRYRIYLTDKGHASIPYLISLAEEAENILSVTKKGSNPHGFETL